MKVIGKFNPMNHLINKNIFQNMIRNKFNSIVKHTINNEQKFEYIKPIEKPVDIPLWSHSFFNTNSNLLLPIIDLKTQSYTNKNVCLPHDIFNCVIRRDLIHKVFYYNQCYNKISTKTTKNKGTAMGSGQKPFKQKGTGRARQGNKRAPLLKGGGHVFSLSPKEYYFKLNKKIRLVALKSLLSYKFLDKKIIIVNDISNIEALEKILEGNSAIFYCTNELEKSLMEKKQLKLNFSTSLNVQSLMKNQYLVFTEKSIEHLCNVLLERHSRYYVITKKFKNIDTLKEHQMTNIKYDFDPFKKLNLKTTAFKGSYKTILTSKIHPDKLINKALAEVEEKLDNKIKIIERKEKYNH